MGRKRGLTLPDVVGSAAAIADARGLAGVTLTAVAGDLGIATPSLYNHVNGLTGLRRLLALEAARMLAELFESAIGGRSGADALRAAAHAHRAFAAAHPGLYEALLPAPVAADDPELAAAMGAPVATLAAVLRGIGAADDQIVHLVRALRSAVHGFVALERDHGFGLPVDIDSSFAAMVEIVVSGVIAAAAEAHG